MIRLLADFFSCFIFNLLIYFFLDISTTSSLFWEPNHRTVQHKEIEVWILKDLLVVIVFLTFIQKVKNKISDLQMFILNLVEKKNRTVKE